MTTMAHMHACMSSCKSAHAYVRGRSRRLTRQDSACENCRLVGHICDKVCIVLSSVSIGRTKESQNPCFSLIPTHTWLASVVGSDNCDACAHWPAPSLQIASCRHSQGKPFTLLLVSNAAGLLSDTCSHARALQKSWSSGPYKASQAGSWKLWNVIDLTNHV